VIYVALCCGALVKCLWWDAMHLPEADDKRPGCGRWTRFVQKPSMRGKQAA
jgi:hypothetical protein